MIECRYCGEIYFGDPERVGSRCRRCREPLYERRDLLRLPDGLQPVGQCALHPSHPAGSTCERCGTYVCGLCRTRWQERILCVACVERNLESREARPEEVRAHRRGATLGLTFGTLAWALVLAAFPMFLATRTVNGESLVILAGLLTLTSFLPSVFGIGQAATAIRLRGNRLIVATCGLILSGLHLGVVLGMLVLWCFPR